MWMGRLRLVLVGHGATESSTMKPTPCTSYERLAVVGEVWEVWEVKQAGLSLARRCRHTGRHGGDVRCAGVESGEWRVESGEWRVESGEWRGAYPGRRARGPLRREHRRDDEVDVVEVGSFEEHGPVRGIAQLEPANET